MNRTVLIIGLILVAAIVAILFLGLGKDPQAIVSPLIGKPAPPFALKAVGTVPPIMRIRTGSGFAPNSSTMAL